MTEQEYLEINRLIRGGMSLNQASGTNAKRVQYQRMKAKKEREASYNIEPIQEEQEAQEQENFSDEDYAQVIPDWQKLPAIKKELWKKNLAIARKPGASPQNANIHAKTMVALCPEFREKKERTVFTPDDYKKVWLEATESIRNGDKMETYEEHHGLSTDTET